MSAGYESTMQRVLDIPEIVEIIFSFLDKKDNINNACVCRKWSDIAADSVWRNIDDITQLLRLLAPLDTPPAVHPLQYYTFTRMLNAEDWRRFERHARRVRKLSYVRAPNDLNSPYLGGRVLDEIARSRTSINILPNLASLEWCSDETRHSLVFMGPSVKRFSVYLHESTDYSLSDHFKDVSARMPSLTHLDFAFDFAVRDIEADLITLIGELPHLKQLTLPSYSFTSRIVEALSLLPKLETIQFEFWERQGRGDPTDIAVFSPTLREEAFPALWDVNLSAHLPDMTRFITSPHAPAHLTSLYVHLPSAASPSAINEYLTAVAENCQLLERLYMDLFVPPLPGVPHQPVYAESLSWGDLRPLLLCKHLRVFELTWTLPVLMQQDDVEELASSWPSLRILQLNCLPNPVFPLPPPELTLRALMPFATHCPELEELGLDVDTNAAELAFTAHDAAAAAPPPFRKLKRLCFGLSPIAEPGPVALFLSRMCALGCEIAAGPRVPDGFNVVFSDWTLELLDRWTEVGKVLPLLVRLRMEERARRQELEREVEDLRMRCNVLVERATLPEGALNADGSCLVL
ncbi:uncharacterized protein B0H18DRAFT_874169 [Fomitopsis serialis]|uniref:uncharacterized protein n=1 Tax=Fomitopsis serialis TaxID=139415 RepID=UPI0020077E01|nr:uncharacterized protein B0H18DRAFT_874169 [Neoantrodia serialis]KAH9929239.1 hypothetical protein B0H18DRAFT_874169 [Neoantrodia serialis]